MAMRVGGSIDVLIDPVLTQSGLETIQLGRGARTDTIDLGSDAGDRHCVDTVVDVLIRSDRLGADAWPCRLARADAIIGKALVVQSTGVAVHRTRSVAVSIGLNAVTTAEATESRKASETAIERQSLLGSTQAGRCDHI